MADNILVDATTVRSLEDGTSIHHLVGIGAYATTVGTPDVIAIPVAAALADGTSNPTTLLHGCCIEVWNSATWDRAPGTTANGLDVDVTRVIPGTTATALGKAEDAAHTSGDTGVMSLSVRQDTAAALGGTDADYQPLITDASGRLHVNVGNIAAGTNAIGKLAANTGVDIGDVDVTSIVAGTGATNLGKAEDAAHSSGDVGVMALSVRQDTAAALGGTDADYQPLITDSAGRLHTRAMLVNSSGTEITLSTVTEYNEDAATPATIAGGTVMMERDDALSTLTPVEADWAALRCDSVGALWTVVTTVTTLTGGGIAHDAADSGNPHKIGAKATASQLGLTPVAAADRTDLFACTDGALLVRDGSLEDIITERTTNTDGASTALTGAFAATASQRIYLTDITLSNSSATFCTVDIRDGAAGAVLWTFPVPATGGVTHRFSRPIRFTANTALAFDASAATSTVAISVSGFKSKA